MKQDMEFRAKLNPIKLSLMMEDNTTFFSALLSSLKLICDESTQTASTNGVYLKMNPTWCADFDAETLTGLMLHEVMHVAFGHVDFTAYELCDQDILNIAQDHYINLYLKRLGYKLPEGGYADPKFTGMSSMEIYEILIKNPPPKPLESDWNGNDVDTDCPDDMSPQEHKETVMANILGAVYQAQLANDHGSIPGDLLITLEDAINPKLPWQQILAPYVDAYATEDYSWSRPHRRYQPDWYLPRRYSEQIGHITCGDDVSGSMSKADVSEIFAEQKYIFETLNPSSMRVMTFDTKVHLNKVYEEGNELDDIKLKGGGGTNVEPLLDSIRKEKPVFALIFTDGYFDTPDMSGMDDTDIYWIIKGNPGFTAPKGVVIPFH